MHKFKTYQTTQTVSALMVDLEFAQDVEVMSAFLVNYRIQHRTGNIMEPDFSNAQCFYVELYNVQQEEWLMIPHKHYIVVHPAIDTRSVVVSVMTEEDFNTTWDIPVTGHHA